MNATQVLELARRVADLPPDQQQAAVQYLEQLAEAAGTAITAVPLPALPPRPLPGQVAYPAWGERFLITFRAIGNVRASCQGAGISRPTYYHYLRNCPEFAAHVTDAREDACDVLEQELVNLALQHRNLKAIMILLRAYRPDRYSPLRRTEVSGPGGGPIQHEVSDRLKARVHELFKPLPPPPDLTAKLAPPPSFRAASSDAADTIIDGEIVP